MKTDVPLRSPSARQRWMSVCVVALLAAVSSPIGVPIVPALAAAETKPYDDRLMRLAELLGAIHYLRELCSANDGQIWRERMTDLLNAEGASALRRAKLSRSFNQGYRSYSRTYLSCTPSAQSTISRFLTEGAQISDALVKSAP